MLDQYLAALLFLLAGAALGIAILVLGRLVAPRVPETAKELPYECGFDAFSDPGLQFDVRYYRVVILFVLFDLEVAFLFPWAVSLDRIGAYGILAMGVFLFLLLIGYAFEWRRGALEWD